MGTVSKNFSYNEFEASDTAKSLGIINAVTTTEVRDSIKALVNNVLQPLRDAVGKSLHVNSGYRCPALNKAVGGVATSQHARGEAADIRANTAKGDLSPYELAARAKSLSLPYDQMILYPTFVHFSHKLSGAQRGQILYNKSYTGERL